VLGQRRLPSIAVCSETLAKDLTVEVVESLAPSPGLVKGQHCKLVAVAERVGEELMEGGVVLESGDRLGRLQTLGLVRQWQDHEIERTARRQVLTQVGLAVMCGLAACASGSSGAGLPARRERRP
jgi:hypothetical protein